MYISLRIRKRVMLCVIAVLSMLAAVAVMPTFAKEEKTDGIKLPIIMYHSIVKNEDRSGEYVITPIELEKDLLYLKQNGYTTVFVNDVIRYVKRGGELPEKPIILSFDDGTYNYSYLDWQDVSVLRDSGHVEICNHSYDMHNLEGRRGVGQLEGESYEDYRKIFLNDTTKLQTLCDEHCGFQPNVYTYPFGITCESASRLVKNMGFEASLGVEEKTNIIKKEDERCLFGLYRYNRSGIISTEEFMKKVFGA